MAEKKWGEIEKITPGLKEESAAWRKKTTQQQWHPTELQSGVGELSVYNSSYLYILYFQYLP